MAYIISVDQSTSSSKAFLLNEKGIPLRNVSAAHRQSFPKPGYAEHDAGEIFANVLKAIAQVTDGIPKREIIALSIANQRETTVLWDRKTGEPLCPAIVWQDVRGSGWCKRRSSESDAVRKKTGLALSPYYSAAKAASVLAENPAFLNKELCIGTIDSYLIFRLSGGKSFYTDTSNASRTQLMNLKSLQWDQELCSFFGIAQNLLPSILPSDAVFGHTADGIPITGVMGDSHAALFGHGCHEKGTAKATYGTGSSVMLNVGPEPVFSSHGLSSSVGFTFGGQTRYVLEGNVTSSGDTLCWLRDQLGLIQDLEMLERLAASVPDTQGVFLVPAFSGLGAPYFAENARAILCGMNRNTTKAHILRAALESIAHQDADILDMMAMDTGAPIHCLHADGGASSNKLLMQLQADLVPVTVQCAASPDLSALGAGYMAGLAAGVYPNFDTLEHAVSPGAMYNPSIPEDKRVAQRLGWKQAVEKSI